MSDDKRYNGWRNYETWNAALWMGEDSSCYWEERAEELVKDADGDKESATSDLAREMEERSDEDMPEVSGMYADILGAGLREIDWREIAEHYVDDVEIEDDEEEAA